MVRTLISATTMTTFYLVQTTFLIDRCYVTDYRLATHTIATLQLAKREAKPFFVMAGFRRPHRDFLVHQQYWDLYPPATDIATAKYPVRSPSQPLIGECLMSRGTIHSGATSF